MSGVLCTSYICGTADGGKPLFVIGGKARGSEEQIEITMKLTSIIRLNSARRLRAVGAVLVALAAGASRAAAQAFDSTDLKTGISNSLAVIMMFGFVLGIAAVIAGGFAIRRGDVDQGKMSIIGGAIIAAAPAVIFAFFKIFGIEDSSSIGVGAF